MADASWPKVFCIGLNKTGTTSMGNALEALGYKRSGWHDWRSRILTHEWWAGHIDRVIAHADDYNAFEDIPWPQLYRKMANHYPTAKFILTTRSDEQKWLRSIAEHNHRRPWVGHQIIYGAYEPLDNEEKYLEVYRAHNAAVRNFFADTPDRLLELCIDQNRDWGMLCEFLGISELPTFPFPRANVTASHRFLLDIGRAVWHPIHQFEVAYVSTFYPQSYAVVDKAVAESKTRPLSRVRNARQQQLLASRPSWQFLLFSLVAGWQFFRVDLMVLGAAAFAGAPFQLPSQHGESSHEVRLNSSGRRMIEKG